MKLEEYLNFWEIVSYLEKCELNEYSRKFLDKSINLYNSGFYVSAKQNINNAIHYMKDHKNV